MTDEVTIEAPTVTESDVKTPPVLKRSVLPSVVLIITGAAMFIISCAISWYISFLRTEHRIYTSGLARCYLIDTPRGRVLASSSATSDKEDKTVDRHPGVGK